VLVEAHGWLVEVDWPLTVVDWSLLQALQDVPVMHGVARLAKAPHMQAVRERRIAKTFHAFMDLYDAVRDWCGTQALHGDALTDASRRDAD
jgi:hypothetical protein